MEDVAVSRQEDAKAPDVSTLKALGLPRPDFHSLILDLGALSFVDTVCIKSLKNVRGYEQATPPGSTLTLSLALRAL